MQSQNQDSRDKDDNKQGLKKREPKVFEGKSAQISVFELKAEKKSYPPQSEVDQRTETFQNIRAKNVQAFLPQKKA